MSKHVKQEVVGRVIFPPASTLLQTKPQARKNWKGPLEIPEGFSQWTAGKKKVRITILRATETNLLVINDVQEADNRG